MTKTIQRVVTERNVEIHSQKDAQEIRTILDDDDNICPTCGLEGQKIVDELNETRLLACTICDTHWTATYELRKKIEFTDEYKWLPSSEGWYAAYKIYPNRKKS